MQKIFKKNTSPVSTYWTPSPKIKTESSHYPDGAVLVKLKPLPQLNDLEIMERELIKRTTLQK